MRKKDLDSFSAHTTGFGQNDCRFTCDSVSAGGLFILMSKIEYSRLLAPGGTASPHFARGNVSRNKHYMSGRVWEEDSVTMLSLSDKSSGIS